jgi:hypothetical protein
MTKIGYLNTSAMYHLPTSTNILRVVLIVSGKELGCDERGKLYVDRRNS